jgi:hypothetical protein
MPILKGRGSGIANSALNAGFQYTRDLGTDGDWFVSKTGDNTTGTSPATAFRTIDQARIAASAGQTIRVIGNGAIYREAVNLTDKGGTSTSVVTKLLAYGTDKPIISGAETLTTWTLCSSPTDDAVLGAALAATGKVWKKTGLATTLFAGGTGGAGGTTLAANLYQNGVKLNIATGKAIRSIYPDVDVYTPNWLSGTTNLYSGTVTISNASPAVVTLASHGVAAGTSLVFTTTGALPTGLTAGTTYYVKTVLSVNTFTVSATSGGAAINTSSAGSGVHTATFNLIRSYLLPLDLQGKGFTSGQFTDVVVLQHIGGNAEYANTVSAFSADTVTVTTLQSYDTGSAYADFFSLQNFLPEMRAGEWGFRDTGGGNVTLYVWPHDASLGANMVIDYSARGFGIKIGASGCTASLNSYIEIAGFIIERQSSNGADTDGNEAISLGGAPASGHRTNISIHDCMIRDTWRKDRAYGQIWAQYTDYLTVQRLTLRKLINSFGVFFQGEPWYDAQCPGLRFMDNIIEEASNSCVRMMGQKNVVIARNRFINSCIGDHSNQLNPYVISKDIVLYGNIFQDCTGYITWGDSDPPDMLFNYVDSSHTLASGTYDARGIVNQNNNDPGVLTQGMSKVAYTAACPGGIFANPQAPPCWYDNTPVTAVIACNQVTPNSLNTSSTAQGMALGISDPDAITAYTGYFNCQTVNNVTNGIAFVADTWAASCLSNLTTKGALSITGLTVVDSSNVDGSNASEYTDIALNNWYAPPGAIRRTKIGITTQSIASEIATLKTRFSDVSTIFDYDCGGREYNKANPPVGPFTNVDDTPSYAPLFWTPPTLGGAPSVGSTSNVSVPVSAGYPVSTLSYQWYTVSDYRDVSTRGSLLGTGTISPTWASGNLGAYSACKTIDANSAGALYAWSVGLTPINSGALISTPSVLGSKTARATGASTGATQTNNITSTGLPLVLVIGAWGIASGTYITWTVDVDGTPMTAKSNSTCIQSNTQFAVFMLTGLAAGPHTITMAPSSNYFAFVAQSMEIGGTTNLINGTKTGASTTTVMPTVTPTFNDGAVIHVCARGGGDIATYPVDLTNATQELQINSGTSGVSDMVLTVGFEQWASTAPCSATFTSGGSSPPNRQYIAMSFSIDP